MGCVPTPFCSLSPFSFLSFPLFLLLFIVVLRLQALLFLSLIALASCVGMFLYFSPYVFFIYFISYPTTCICSFNHSQPPYKHICIFHFFLFPFVLNVRSVWVIAEIAPSDWVQKHWREESPSPCYILILFNFLFFFYFLNFVLKLLDLYLSYNTGDDGRSCTLGFACKTLKRASEVWMQADTVFLEAGDYSIFLWEKNRKRKRTWI